MSYDLAIACSPIADTDASAWHGIDRLIEDKGEPPEILRAFYEAITRRYPCLSMLSDEDGESGVWSSAPLWGEFGTRAAVLPVQFPRADEVVPFVVEMARSLGLTVFDWQTKLVLRADGIEGLELTSEDVAPLKRPALHQIMDAALALTPDGGPGFLVLERAGRDYMQVAGGNGAYTCGWRMYDGNGPRFTHCAIGFSDVVSSADIQIPTNGFP